LLQESFIKVIVLFSQESETLYASKIVFVDLSIFENIHIIVQVSANFIWL